MATTAEIKNNLVIEMNHGLWQVVEFQHVKPGKGNAFVRTKLKNLTTGKVVDNTFPAGHKIETARIERRTFQYLYKDDMGFHFMNNENYEQVSLQEGLVNNAGLMKEGQTVEVLYHAEKEIPLTLELPNTVNLKISYSEPGLKGDTATNATKAATLETGSIIQVPLFVNEGETVKVDTKSGSYIERVKK